MYRYDIETDRSGLFEITENVRLAVEQSGVRDGVAVLFIPHTTAGASVISRMDPLGLLDIEEEFARMVPTRVDFRHQFDTPTDASGHIKSALAGVSVSIPIEDGDLQIGSSQGIFFFEFDGPRKRKYLVQILSCGGNDHGAA